jgi:glucose-6-phosphate 1-epimerase
MHINHLNANFGIQDQVKFYTGSGGFPIIHVNNKNAFAVISVYGAQILSFLPRDEQVDMLFLSNKAVYEEGKAIRGGIPVCWPWFGPDPKGLQRPNHGFVRNQLWTLSETATTDTETKISLQFTERQNNEKTWKLPFRLNLEINISKILTLQLITRNTGDKPFSVTQAFQSYFNVGDIRKAQILGLEGCSYFDKLDQGREKIQTGIVSIAEEVDRIYENIENHLVLLDPVHHRRVKIKSDNCRTGVVWNPWQNKMADLAEEDYQRFVCVETGNMAFDVVQVPPGEQVSLLTSYQILPII